MKNTVKIITTRASNYNRIRGRFSPRYTIVKRGNWAKKNDVFDRCPECGRIRFYWQCRNNECGYSEDIYSVYGNAKILSLIWGGFLK